MRWRAGRTRAIGLDAGARSIKAIQLAGAPGAWRLAAAAAIPRESAAPDGAADDGVANQGVAASAAMNPPLAHAPGTLTPSEVARLGDVLDRQGFTGRRIVLAVPPANLVTAVLELPPPDSAAPRPQIARNELAAMHRLDPRTIELSFWDLPATARARDSSRVIAAACPHAAAYALLDAFEAGGLDPVALDIKAAAIARAAAGPAHGGAHHAPGVTAVLDLGHADALLVLLYRGTIIYERRIGEAGVGAVRAALTADLGPEPDAADFLLREVGLRDPAPPGDPEPTAAGDGGCATAAIDPALLADLHALLRAHCDRLLAELRTSLSYAAHQYPDAPFEHLRVIGGGAAIPGLCDHLAAAAQLSVSPLVPAERAAVGDTPLAHDPALTTALGLAMHEEAR